MKLRAVISSLLVAAVLGALPIACARAHLAAGRSVADLPAIALRESGQASDEAIARLRALGPEGLRAILAHADAQAAATLEPNGLPRLPPAKAERVREAVDRVAGQRDALASRLFWHEDLERAKEQALREGKPILSLRLLGRLEDLR